MKNKSTGFTLLEVVVAMVILSFLSLFTFQSIQSALKAKTRIQSDLDRTSTLRDALRIMERDINLAFNYRDIGIKLHNDMQKVRQAKAKAGAGRPPGGQPGIGTTSPSTDPDPNAGVGAANPADAEKYKLKTEKIYTQFLGEKNKIDFTTLSNMRMTEDSAISMQAEVGYHLKPCRRRSTQEQSSQCLWRRISNYLHDDITKEGEETALLENVTAFSLRYLGPGREEEWVDTWLTDDRGDDQTKGKFPYAVEITIEVHDTTAKPKTKPLRMTAVASIRNPNNFVEEERKENGTATTTQPN